MKKITLRNLALGLGITLFSGLAHAQGLENIIVERYYVADANDAAGSVGTLPVGSVTYRVYVDMLPGYKFQALYGVTGHTLSFSTTTSFFNNEDRGATTPAFTKNQAQGNTVMLDSWFSVGGAATNSMGVPKADDNGVANAVNSNGLLQNNTFGDIPLTTQDGFITGTPQSVTFVGLTNGVTATDLSVFADVSQVGNLFTTDNGSIASLNGSVGPDTATNKVLVGQFTTDGVFCFQLNVQIGTPTFTSENYVAQGPVTGNEVQLGILNYCSNTVNVQNTSAAPSTSISVYPNPVTDAFTINIKTNDKGNTNSYRVYDVIGNIIADKDLGMISENYSEKVDMSSFSKGIYFVEFNLDGVKTTKKIIKY